MNKAFAFLIFILCAFIGILMFDTDLKFNYINTHNNTTATNISKVPQVLPSIPYQFVNIIFLIIVIGIIVGIFLYIVKVYNQ